MAEVTGDLGGQPIQLNNAATEATLKQLLAAMTTIANNTGKDKAAQAKSQKELEAELKKLAAAAKKQEVAQTKNTDATEDNTDAKKKDTQEQKKKLEADKKAIKAQQEYIAELNGLKGAMSGLGSSVASLATGMTGMLSSLANLGDSLSSTAAVFGQIPVVGGVLSSMFGAVAGAAEKTYEAFKKSASVGANFGGSMTEMMDSATSAGLTFDQFSGIIARTGKDLALLGGDSEAGARRLASLGKQIKGTTLAADLNRLGYSTEAINESMVTYAGQLAKTGALKGMSDAQLVAHTGAYLKDLDTLTKLTGQSKKELEDQRAARMNDAQFRKTLSKLDAESQKNLHNLMDSIPKEHQEGMKEIIATGTATSEAGKAALAFLPESSKAMMGLNQQIRNTGKVGAQDQRAISDAYQREATKVSKTGLADNLADYGNAAQQKFYIGLAEAAGRSKSYGQIQDEQQKAAAERAAKEKELKDKQLSPADMEAYKNKIAETSNEFTKFLANSGMLDIMMEAFRTLVDIVELVVVPAFQFVVDHFGTIATVVGVTYAAFLGLKAVILAAQVKLALQTLAAGANTVATTGATVAMGKAGIAASIMSLPFIKITLVVGLLVGAFLLVKKIFTELYNAGWDLGTIFEAIGDSFKSVLLTIQEGFLGLLDKLTFGDANKKIKEAQKGIEVERQALKEKEKARDAQREANKSARAAEKAKEELETVSGRKAARAKEKEAEASDAVSKAKEKETEAAKASTSVPGVNLSSPQAMYDSMVKRQQGGTAGAANPPGATTTAPVTSAATPPPINQDQAKNMELIKAALQKQGITDPKYIAATLGNVMKETGGKSQSENLNYGKTDNTRIRSIFGKRAAGKSDAELDAIKKDPQQMGEMMYGKDTKIGLQMGNNEPGDGFKYRGRGFIQLTGKGNYSAASKAIYGDDRLVVNPDMVNDPAVAADVSAWYMKKGQAGMAKKMGIDTANMTQADANVLATSQIAGTDVRKAGGYLGGEVLSKVNAYAGQMAGIAGTPAQTVATTSLTTPAVDSNLANNYAWSVFSGKQDPSSVPESYRSAVNSILKSPPVHWAQAAGKAPATTTVAGTPSTAQTVATTSLTTPAVDSNLANNYAWSVFSGKQDPSSVPERYRGMVNDILKKPPTHWAQAAGKAPTATALVQSKPLSGVAENMALYGQQAPNFSAVQASMSLPSNIPNTAAVQTAVTPAAAGATTQQAEAARAAAAATDPRRSDRPQTAVAGARQETPESLLASLNTKMDQLIAINRSLKDTNERQLSVQKGIAQSGDLYAAA